MLTKELLQDNSALFYARHKKVAIFWATGVGKSRAGCLCIKRMWEDPQLDTGGYVVIAVDSSIAKKHTWPKEMEKWGVPKGTGRIILSTWKSLPKLKGLHITLFVGDEAHSVTEANSVFFNQNRIDGIVLLTATPPEPDELFKRQIFQRLVGPHTMTVTVDEAVDYGLVNDFRVIALEYEIEGQEWAEYLERCRQLDHAMTTGNQGYIDAMINKRMHFVYNLPSKIEMAGKFLAQERIQSTRLLVFCSNIAQAERIGFPTYHSESPDDRNLTLFTNEQINHLATVFSLRQGANFKHLLYGLVLQIQARKRKFVQTIGRFLRGKPGEKGTVWVIVATNTVDKNWYDKATADINPARKFTFQLKDLP